jgi:hypothetical protein
VARDTVNGSGLKARAVPDKPVLTRRPDGGYTVTRGGVELGRVERMARSWAWRMPGESLMLADTRKGAVQRLVDCHDVRAMVERSEADAAARDAARTAEAVAAGYELVDLATITEGDMVRLWSGSHRVWGDPVLATRVTECGNGAACLSYVRLTPDASPVDVALLLPASRMVMRRGRTPDADQVWAWWLAESDDSPDACAARAVPPGWMPGAWDEVHPGDAVRYPTRIRHDRVYEWSRPITVDHITIYGDGRVWLIGDRAHESVPALIAAERGCLMNKENAT